MTELSPEDLRRHVASLVEPGGRYLVSCARTGERPFPVAAKRFPDRETAAEAADVAERYRDLLRAEGADLPYHDLIVREDPTLAALD